MTQYANNTPNEKELELINSYTRNPLCAEDVYCFNITLCDNEVDRDYERFSVESLEKLAELFVGKTGISDHNMSSENQKARIFSTWLEKDDSKKTSVGESYVALRAKAYMLLTNSNRDMIEQIEGGIKKEVSVGCSMGSMTCSICSKSMKTHECNHIKGKHYGKKLCHGILGDAADAYEWSFVAVPAQKKAGVTKSLEKNSSEKFHSDDMLNSLDTKTAVYSCKYVNELKKRAEEGELYRNRLISEIKKYSLIAMHKVDIETFIYSCKHMETKALETLKESLFAQASEIIPLMPQLKPAACKQISENNNSFKI